MRLLGNWFSVAIIAQCKRALPEWKLPTLTACLRGTCIGRRPTRRRKRNVHFITEEGELLIYQEITQPGPAQVEGLVDAMYELWASDVSDYIFHAEPLE